MAEEKKKTHTTLKDARLAKKKRLKAESERKAKADTAGTAEKKVQK